MKVKKKRADLTILREQNDQFSRSSVPTRAEFGEQGEQFAPQVLQGIKKVFLPLGRNSKWDKRASRLGFPGFENGNE